MGKRGKTRSWQRIAIVWMPAGPIHGPTALAAVRLEQWTILRAGRMPRHAPRGAKLYVDADWRMVYVAMRLPRRRAQAMVGRAMLKIADDAQRRRPARMEAA